MASPAEALRDRLEREARVRPAQAVADLVEARRCHGLEAVPTFAWPVILDRRDEERLAQAAEAITAAVGRLLDEVRAGEHPGQVPVDERTAAFLAQDRGHRRLQSCRLDVLYDPSTGALALLEVQAGDPSGLGWSDVFAAAFLASGPLAEAGARGGELLVGHAQAALGVLEDFAGGERAHEPIVAFACPAGSFVRSDHEAMAHRYRQQGLSATVVDPRDFEVRGERLVAGGRSIDLVVRDTHEELLEEPLYDEARALRESLGRRCAVMNPIGDLLADDKALLAVLADEGWRARLAPSVAAELASALPETRLVRKGPDPDDRTLLERWRTDKDSWVLKPAAGYGGFDVVLGDQHDDASWTAALERALAGRYVAQRRVPTPRTRLAPLVGDEPGAPRELPFTLGLWCHDGQFSGAYARAADALVINVHQGGGLVPVFFVG